MRKVMLEWQIERGMIDSEDLSASEDREMAARVLSAGKLAKGRASKDRVRAALGPVSLEWSWSNCDADPSEVLEDPQDFVLQLDGKNSDIVLEAVHGDLLFSARVRFEVSVKPGVDTDALNEWLEANAAYCCGLASGGWCYSGDEGASVTVSE